MGEGFQALDIILFAMIAAFLVLRLRSVLGKRTGHERQPPEDPFSPSDKAANDDNVVELPDRRSDDVAPGEAMEIDDDDPVSAGITEIRIADPSFSPSEFLEGARAAFEMIVQAYADGDREALRNLLNDEVYDDFAAALQDREQAGETLDFTLIGLKDATIIDARMDGRMAFVTILFESEQVNVVNDKDGKVISGDPNRIEQVSDVWTFARNTKARDPNWTLVETRTPDQD